MNLIDLSFESSDNCNSEQINNSKRRKLNDSNKMKWKPFYLLSCNSTKNRMNTDISLTDIINSNDYKIDNIILYNYMIDITWLLGECPNIVTQSIPTLFIHGDDLDRKSIQTIKNLSNIMTSKVNMGSERFGTHHCKMALIFYENGVRIAIFTSNFIEMDFKYLTNAVYIQDFPICSSNSNSINETNFKSDLITFCNKVNIMNNHTLYNSLINKLNSYDFSNAEVYLIASIPGRHNGISINKYGHKRLSNILETYQQKKMDSSDIYSYSDEKLIMQYSSIGSLGKNEKYLDELISSMTKSMKLPNNFGSNTSVQLIWPTIESVRNSIIGYESGTSLPSSYKTIYNENNEIRDGLKSKLYVWEGLPNNRKNIIAHMKCYFTYHINTFDDINLPEIDWFLLTSANLSQAAWGVLERNNTQLYIKSYELGVLFLRNKIYTTKRLFSLTPSHSILGLDDTITYQLNKNNLSKFYLSNSSDNSDVLDEDSIAFPIPFQVPPRIYSKNDKPWVWDIPYSFPDCLGRRKS